MERTQLWRAVRRPESAAVAGLVFAALLTVVIVELRSVGAEPERWGTWFTDPGARGSVSLALALVPFAGIAFLWFIAVVRAQVASAEDRFVETVFLGSGLLFTAMLFTTAAVLTAVLRLDAVLPVSREAAAAAMAFGSALLGQFGTRMAAVFTLTLTTAGRLGGGLPRWLVVLGYGVGLLLLLSPPLPTLMQFAFPAWVAVLSATVLVRRRATTAEG
ncbi:MAG TPA: hypothetical protein VFL59_06035 [Candidatus Nanopelagicales bacterium]|nr:hypothetical protein [Candidatus Nanopelagicales bacterium]